jgi:hypothetical protein
MCLAQSHWLFNNGNKLLRSLRHFVKKYKSVLSQKSVLLTF